jgi:hypothetical protein
MVNDLVNLRRDTDTAEGPIIFVTHSLGGLVCQDALFQCTNPKEDAHGDILQSTRAVAFLGTPQAGSDLTKFAKLAERSIRAIKTTNHDLLSVLDRRSEVLARTRDDFQTMLKNRMQKGQGSIKIHTFIEEYPMPILKGVCSFILLGHLASS